MDPKFEIKLNPDSKEVLFGSAIIQLEDKSHQTFKTVDLYDFVEWSKAYKKKHAEEELMVEYNDQQVKLFQDLQGSEPRFDHPNATCVLTNHARLNILTHAEGKWFKIQDFEELLTVLRENGEADIVDVIGHLRDFRVTKVTSISRQRDPRTGDFTFEYSRKKADTGKDMGRNEFEPPQTLSFEIPLFEVVKDKSKFTFEFMFDYEESDGEYELKFKLKNITFVEQVKNARKAIIQSYITSLGYPAYWGERSTITATDAWKYQTNKL